MILASIIAALAVFDAVVAPKFSGQDLFARSNRELSGVQSHCLFTRKTSPTSDLEATLDSILTSLGDTAPFVEYWSRARWQNLDAHRDVDEHHAKSLPLLPEWGKVSCERGDFRFPSNGHVLYLDIEGEEVGLGKGGTALFAENWNEVTVVPPRNGRLLRFRGDMRHAVPRGPLSYFDSDEVPGGTSHLIYTRRRDDRERRGVVLFNTWQERPQGKWDETDVEQEVRTCASIIDKLRESMLRAHKL